MSEKKPMSPQEALSRKFEVIDPIMIEAVDHLILKSFDGGSVTIMKEDVISEYLSRDLRKYKTRSEIFDNGQLKFDVVYRNVGWKVTYDKPGYNETYQGNWTFTPKK